MTLSWQPYHKRDDFWKGFSVYGGIIFPTGEPAEQILEDSLVRDVFQLGTGAYQLSLGSSVNWSSYDWNHQVAINTTLPLNEGSDGFKPADSYSASIKTSKALNENFSFHMGFSYLQSEPDRFRGVDLVTAYTSVSFKTGIIWQINDSLSLSSSLDIPIYRDVDEIQIAVGPQFQIGMSRSF